MNLRPVEMFLCMRKAMSLVLSRIREWRGSECGVAAVEAALLFPVLMTLMIGMNDIGYGILANQKTIAASQVSADLLARFRTVTYTDIDDAIEAARLALEPLDDDNFGVDVVSIEFDDNGDPEIVWRETRNMSPNDNAVNSTTGLGVSGEGVLIVTVEYQYEPAFSGFVIDTISMQEVAFVRGRRNSVIRLDS